MDVVVAPMQVADIPAVQAIEDQSFPTSWPRDSFGSELERNQVARYITARQGETVVGYAGMWLILDEAHVTTIAVDPQVRGQKVGKRLLWEMLRICYEAGVKWAILEVRESNQVAQAMYRRFGFKQVGVRKRYYENEENAIVMWVGQMQSTAFARLLEAASAEWALEYQAPPLP